MTSRGLVDVLQQELSQLGISKTEKVPGGVFFDSNWEGCYKANVHLRTATRVVLPILDFPAYTPEDLYHNILKHDFTKYISPDGTIAVDASVRESKMHDQRFIALKTKDAIVDQFRDKFSQRPNVETDNPDLRVIVRGVKNQFSVSVDTTGEPLFKRGYRKENVLAPLKEHLAAGLIMMTGWDGSIPIVDLMCGSGTILIEAALMALKIPPGTLRPHFAFEKFASFDQEKFETIVNAAMDQELDELPFQLYGFDIDRKAIHASLTNVKQAGVANRIVFKRQSVDLVEPPAEKGIVIVNPPYGERLSSPEALKDVYRDLAFILKSKFKGWSAWILAGDPELTKELKMKAKLKIRVFNGPIECRFLHYEIRRT